MKKSTGQKCIKTVHKICRVIMFRAIEAILVVVGVTIIVLAIGCLIVPNVSFSMATSVGLTQGTDLYTASALWFMPSLFFTLLISAGTFCILRIVLIKTHKLFSDIISRGNAKDAVEMRAQ